MYYFLILRVAATMIGQWNLPETEKHKIISAKFIIHKNILMLPL